MCYCTVSVSVIHPSHAGIVSKWLNPDCWEFHNRESPKTQVSSNVKILHKYKRVLSLAKHLLTITHILPFTKQLAAVGIE